MFSLLALVAAPALMPDGHKLPIGTSCYAITTTSDGVQSTIGNVMQTVRRRKSGKIDALEIVVHQKLTNGKFDMRDEFLVRRDNLLPIHLINVRNGVSHARLDYSASQVTGWKEEKGIRTPIMMALNGPVWDGNLWGLTFAALPLRAGGKYTIPIYQYDKGLGEFSVNVIGQKEMRVGRKTTAAWVLDAGVAKDRRSEYYVSKQGQELGYSAPRVSQLLRSDCSGFD